MPALITHHLFGEEAATHLPEGIVSGQEELIAFLLGNQGPDPFFARFRTLPTRAAACHRLARAMHDGHVTAAFASLRDGASHVPEEEASVARAFVLGLLAHYVLDSTAHPFVYAQEDAICSAGVGLEDAGTDVHAVIESDIDGWVLWQERHETVESFDVISVLASTQRIDHVAGALLSKTAGEVFGIGLGPEQYAGSVGDYRFAYKAVEPANSPKVRFFADVERLVRPHSHLASMSHQVIDSDDCPAINLERRVWRDPSTGKPSTESFADLYHDAVNAYPGFAEALAMGNLARLRELCAGRNYDGRVVDDE